MSEQNTFYTDRKDKSTVLIVDDQPKNLQLAASVLNAHYKLLLADGGQKALKIAAEKQPDLILLDVMMPGISGYEVCQQLKENPQTAAIPVIFLTAKNEEEDILQAFEVGGVDYVTKPFKAREVLARIKTQISLRQAEKRLRQVIDLVPHRLFAKDAEDRIVLANNATAAFYNSTVEELVGKQEPEVENGTYLQNTDETNNCEEQLKLSNGKTHYYQTTKLPFTFSGTELPALLEIAVDVTALKEQQQEISDLNRSLMQHNTYKDKLLSIIAHDLRGPLGGAVGLLDLIHKNQEKLSKEKILDYVAKLKDSTGHTLELLNNLLLWTQNQFERVSIKPTNLNLHTELQRVLKQLSHQASAKQVQLHCNASQTLQVHADADMLQTILRNLISNAIKFTPGGKSVHITAEATLGFMDVQVQDEGVGISEENLQKLQQETPVNHSTFGTNREKGSGLGLSLCRDFIKLHGGQLHIKSTEGVGSCFSFTIPAAK